MIEYSVYFYVHIRVHVRTSTGEEASVKTIIVPGPGFLKYPIKNKKSLLFFSSDSLDTNIHLFAHFQMYSLNYL